MGVSISFRGSVPEPDARVRLLELASRFAHDMQWAVRPLAPAPPLASLGEEILERPELAGLALVPHFACEPLPLLCAGRNGVLVDAYLDETADGPARLEPEPIVKTQFAGPAVHREVCEFLRQVREAVAPDLVVDDEAGWFASGDDAMLEERFAEAWAETARRVRASTFEPGEVFEVGGFELVAGRRGRGEGPSEFEGVSDEVRDILCGLADGLTAGYSGMGLDLDGTERSVEDLDLLMMEADERGLARRPDDPGTERFVHESGAYFGRALVRALGGSWEVADSDVLRLADVGGVGLRVDPFEVATARLVSGPAWGFGHHLEVCRTLQRWVPVT